MKYFDGTTSAVINAIAPDLSVRIPEATAANLQEIGNLILSQRQLTNEFLNALVNRICSVVIRDNLYNNPLQFFKKATERYGDITEEIFVAVANAHEYDPRVAEDEVYKREIPNVSTFFHSMNSKLFYKVTIQEDDLRRAFTGENGVQSLIARIVDSLYSGANYDEFEQMKNIFSAARHGFFYIHTSAPAKATIEDITTQIKAASNLLPFMSENYNASGVLTFTPKSRQILLVRTDVDAVMDVSSLAVAFNMDKREFMGRKILVDNFGAGNEDVYAILCDEEFLLVRENNVKFTEQFNAQGIFWNYFLHRWETFSASPFAGCIAFTTATIVPVTAIEIDQIGQSLAAGQDMLLTATITPLNATTDSVKWSVDSTDKDSGTYITAGGYLRIGAHQTADVIITAKAMGGTNVVGTAKWSNGTIVETE